MTTLSPAKNADGDACPGMSIKPCRGLVINAPHLFADPDFRRWLFGRDPKFTWARGGRVDEWSDTIVLVDPGLGGEGSDSDMPGFAWAEILAACRRHLPADPCGACHYMVRLTNLTVA